MDTFKIVITEKDGWQREFRGRRNIVQIGSAAQNDIVLDRPGAQPVAPRHAQLIVTPEGYRLINLSDAPITLSADKQRTVPPHGVVMVEEDEEILIGDFTLIPGAGIGCDTAPATTSAAGAIGLSVHLSQNVLAEKPIEGTIIVRNLGSQPGTQFLLDIQGISQLCYDIGPGPILYPNAEREVAFSIYNPRGPDLPAGRQRIQIVATAPEAYPGQRAVAAEQITVLPVYSYDLQVVMK